MSAPCQSACSPWSSVDQLPTKCADADPEVAEQALADATDILFELSGRKWPGWCQETVRPCGTSFRMTGYLRAGQWGDRSWNGFCSCNQSVKCGCSYLSEVTLGSFPVVRIDQVRLDGEVLDPTEYRVDDFMYLVRLPDADGNRRGWPCCQRVEFPASLDDTFEVTYTYGSEPNGAGKSAAAALACQLIRSRSGEPCDLPPNVQSLSRQGVTMNIQSVVSLLDKGQTGVTEADRWLKSVNPTGQHRPAGILIPGAPSSARRITT